MVAPKRVPLYRIMWEIRDYNGMVAHPLSSPLTWEETLIGVRAARGSSFIRPLYVLEATNVERYV